MYMLNKTWGNSWFVVTYFVLLVAFGAFFVMNLAMAVIWDEYAAADEERQEKELADQLQHDAQEVLNQAVRDKENALKPKLSMEDIARAQASSDFLLEKNKYCVQQSCVGASSVRCMHALVSRYSFLFFDPFDNIGKKKFNIFFFLFNPVVHSMRLLLCLYC